MQKINKVALIGAGAIGCYFIDCFKDTKDLDFCVIAEGSRKDRLEKEGVKVNGRILKPQVKSPREAGQQDLILIATKYMALDTAISYLPPMMGEGTLVLSLLNGVDSEERVAAAVGEEHVIYSLMRISSERRNGEVNYTLNPQMGLFFGLTEEQREIYAGRPGLRKGTAEAETEGIPEASVSRESLEASVNRSSTETVENPENPVTRLSGFFDRTAVYYHVIDNILEDIWYKYAGNISNNLPQAVLGVPAKLYETKEGIYLRDTLWAEVRSIALAKGIALPAEPCVWNFPKARYSTLQDLDAKRTTEIDMFTGVLIRMAEEEGLLVPTAAAVHHMIKALEMKNSGFYEE